MPLPSLTGAFAHVVADDHGWLVASPPIPYTSSECPDSSAFVAAISSMSRYAKFSMVVSATGIDDRSKCRYAFANSSEFHAPTLNAVSLPCGVDGWK